jgi:hypothetical protein
MDEMELERFDEAPRRLKVVKRERESVAFLRAPLRAHRVVATI